MLCCLDGWLLNGYVEVVSSWDRGANGELLGSEV
jgi:hypothetical protein